MTTINNCSFKLGFLPPVDIYLGVVSGSHVEKWQIKINSTLCKAWTRSIGLPLITAHAWPRQPVGHICWLSCWISLRWVMGHYPPKFSILHPRAHAKTTSHFGGECITPDIVAETRNISIFLCFRALSGMRLDTKICEFLSTQTLHQSCPLFLCWTLLSFHKE